MHNLFIKAIKSIAIAGAGAASIFMSYQPKTPEALQEKD